MSLPRSCNECGAPALQNRAECWSCGRVLTAPPSDSPVMQGAGGPAPGVPQAPPCPGCGNAFAGYLPRCPACGEKSGVTPVPEVPWGWAAERTRTGSLLLRRTALGRVLGPFSRVQVAAVVLFWVITFGLFGFRQAQKPPFERRRTALPPAVTFSLFFGPWLLVAGIRGAYGRHELEMAEDHLRVHEALGPWGRTRTIRTGVLRVVERFDRRGRRYWRLEVEGVGGREVLEVGGLVGSGPLKRLGRLLAEETGWELRTPEERTSWG